MTSSRQAISSPGANLVAVVTGGSRGIGRAFVVEASRRGYDVLFSHRGRGNDAEQTILEASAHGTRVFGIQCDVQLEEDLRRIARAALDMGEVHLLINNAGMLYHAALADITDEGWAESFAVHVTAPMILTRELAPSLARTRGAVLNLSSTGGLVGSVHGASYGASKAAIVGLSKTLARELAPDVRVNSMAPGPVATDLYSTIPADEREAVEAETPLGRVGRPEEIARAGLDVCHWTYATGQTVTIDGGRVMQ